MTRIKFDSSVTLALFFVGALGLEGWLLLKERKLVNHAMNAVNQRIAERDWLSKKSPALTVEGEQAIGVDLAAASQALDALRSNLQGSDTRWLNVRPPAKPLDAFFDIAGFIEKTRAAATQAGVGFAADEHFGFAAYSTVGPASELLPGVYRQRLVAQRLLGALIDARPRALLGFYLEAPVSAAAAGKNTATGYFSFDPAFSLRQPGQIDTLAFRLEFSGQTATLREFLNKVAGYPQPFVVRSVEVEPLSVSGSPGAANPPPLVHQNFSKFAVIVELVLPGTTPAQSRL